MPVFEIGLLKLENCIVCGLIFHFWSRTALKEKRRYKNTYIFIDGFGCICIKLIFGVLVPPVPLVPLSPLDVHLVVSHLVPPLPLLQLHEGLPAQVILDQEMVQVPLPHHDVLGYYCEPRGVGRLAHLGDDGQL